MLSLILRREEVLSQLRAEIRQDLADGLTEREMLHRFQRRHRRLSGETTLSEFRALVEEVRKCQ